MKILILGGTRFIGKALAKSLANNKSYTIDIFSRKKSALRKVNKKFFGDLENTRIKSNTEYDLIIDFISKKKSHIENITQNFNFKSYLYISTIWVDKKNVYNKSNSYNFDKRYLSKVSKKYINYKIRIENLLKKKLKKKLKIIRLPLILSLKTPRIKYYFDRIFYTNNLIQSYYFNKTYLFYSDLNSITCFFTNFLKNKNRYNKQVYHIFSVFISMPKFIGIISNFLKKKTCINLYSKFFLLKNYKQYLHEDPFINEYKINFSKKNLIKINSSIDIKSLIVANIKKFRIKKKFQYPFIKKEESFINKFLPNEKIIF